MRYLVLIAAIAAVLSPPPSHGETVRLPATADIWLSDGNAHERDTSAGKAPRFKLKSIQEMAAIRFDPSAAAGREVRSAFLYLRRDGPDMLRYIRVSTVNGDWVEGNAVQPYSPGDGATYNLADYASHRPWAWPGSQFCDVVMTSGNTIATWAECEKLPDGWLRVPITPDLVYALIAGDTDGLAVMDGGNLAYFNNYIYSAQSPGSQPYIEVELGGPLTAVPSTPAVKAAPAPERAHLNAGALKLTVAPDPAVFCWRLRLNGRPVERWRVKHPIAGKPTVFYLEDLPPASRIRLEVVAVSRGGRASRPAVLTATSSPALPPGPRLARPRPAPAQRPAVVTSGNLRVWPYPPLVKLSADRLEALNADLGSSPGSPNAVWDGTSVQLFGARGECVSYQLALERAGDAPLTGLSVIPSALAGPGGATIPANQVELQSMWYARNQDGKLQPAYCVPVPPGARLDDAKLGQLQATQRVRTVLVEVYIPKDARPGLYRGSIAVRSNGNKPITLPVRLELLSFAIPNRLSFWPELNAYSIPSPALPYFRLAHDNRCVFNPYQWAPKLEGSGKEIKVVWDEYDRDAGPLLTGEAFRDSRRGPIPTECMYLPYRDDWPTPLTKESYNYQGYWPGRGDDVKHIVEQEMTAPYIGDALSQSYKDAFHAVERQFIQHFAEKGYRGTEMQCIFAGKNTHRINYGSNLWWTTDEPYHWDDWLALQFFTRMWVSGRGNADPKQWASRADISRPQWQGTVLDHLVDTVYFGGSLSDPVTARRCRTLAQETGLKIMTYGSANPDNRSNTESVTWSLVTWLNGGNGVLPWQVLGSDKALDVNDAGAFGGNALLVPGDRFGLPAVADMRLKALRDGEQLIEYLVLLSHKYGLTREQIKAMVEDAVQLSGGRRAGASADDADALRFAHIDAWRLSELRRAIGELVQRKATPAR